MDVTKIKKELSRLRNNGDVSDYGEFSLSAEIDNLKNQSTHNWINYSWENPISHPPAYGNYFVCRKDGKVHWEIWNGAGWAYNEKSITYWARITKPTI
jgi:hypothetical protein